MNKTMQNPKEILSGGPCRRRMQSMHLIPLFVFANLNRKGERK